MTYPEFRDKWLGKGIDFDSSFGYQCVDVYRMYCKESLSVPQSSGVIGAKQIWDTYLQDYFDRIANTPDGVPVQGDIVIWGNGEYGHVGICDSADKKYVTCLEQNWDMKGTGPTELRRHTYINVLGWLKFKDKALEACLEALHGPDGIIKQKENLQREFDEYKKVSEQTIRDKDELVVLITTDRNSFKTQADLLRKELKELRKADTARIQLFSEKLLTKHSDWAAIIAQVEGLITVEDQLRTCESDRKKAVKNLETCTKCLNDCKTPSIPIETHETPSKNGKGVYIWQILLSVWKKIKQLRDRR